MRRATASPAFLVLCVLASCDSAPHPLPFEITPNAARPTGSGGGGGSDPKVSAVEPPSGEQGAQALRVVITGSGFDETSQAIWERDGAPDPKITVHQTIYVKPKEVWADISIAEDAELDLYDVAVTSTGGRKKGIGVELFKVTRKDEEPDLAAEFSLLEFSGEASFGGDGLGDYPGGTVFQASGDATLSVHWGPGNDKQSTRKVRIDYGEDGVENVELFMNVGAVLFVPVGETVDALFVAMIEKANRCDRLVFGSARRNGTPVPGGAFVHVTRDTETTWTVSNLDDEGRGAGCFREEKGRETQVGSYPLKVHFTITALSP